MSQAVLTTANTAQVQLISDGDTTAYFHLQYLQYNAGRLNGVAEVLWSTVFDLSLAILALNVQMDVADVTARGSIVKAVKQSRSIVES